MFWIMVDPCEAAILKSAVLKLSLPNFSWNIVEQAHFVVEGKKHFQDEYLGLPE